MDGILYAAMKCSLGRACAKLKGVLKVTLPKVEEAKKKKIEIKVK